MKQLINRREFVVSASLFAAGAGMGSGVVRGAEPTVFKTTLRKALINNQPDEAYFEKLKAAGYHGAEGGIVSPDIAEKCRAAAEKQGMRIHSVLRGWAEFNSPDAAKVEASRVKTEDALRAAQAFGADAVLLVPCRIGGMKMPDPWDFDIEFDDRNGHVKRVVKGDNSPYEDYIKAHNIAIDTSRENVEKLIPAAEKCGVVLALENVWNNLWVKPDIFAHFVASFKNKWIKAYFDIGNHVKYAPPEQWIRKLGKNVAKLHAKDFKIDRAAKNGGQFVNICDGDVNWLEVRNAIEEVGHSGWLTIEGGKLSMEDHSKRLDKIITGKV